MTDFIGFFEEDLFIPKDEIRYIKHYHDKTFQVQMKNGGQFLVVISDYNFFDLLKALG
jgi:hypothetical protein